MRTLDLSTVGLIAVALWGCDRGNPPPADAPAPSSSVVAAAPSASARAPDILLPAPKPKDPTVHSTPAEIRGFLAKHPNHPRADVLRAAHDHQLLPCRTGIRRHAWCTPKLLPLAIGAETLSDEYLAHCQDCKDRKSVEALKIRLKSVLTSEYSDRARQLEQAAILRKDWAGAAQVLDDYDGLAHPAWRKRALGRLRRHLKQNRVDEPPNVGRGCRVPPRHNLVVSPRTARTGEPLRLIATAPRRLKHVELRLHHGDAHRDLPRRRRKRQSGPPHYWIADLVGGEPGDYRIELISDGKSVACRRFRVLPKRGPATLSKSDQPIVWRAERDWDVASEDLFSAWLAALLNEKEGAHFEGLHNITQNPERNFLFDHLGYGEDSPASGRSLDMTPDCADGPHFFRAYFSWKMRLPFGYYRCKSRGRDGGVGCASWVSNEGVRNFEEEAKAAEAKAAATKAAAKAAADAGAADEEDVQPPDDESQGDSDEANPRQRRKRPPKPRDAVQRFHRLLVKLKNEVHARSLRTPFRRDHSDLYPVRLARAALTPATVFSDPYGHTLTLVRWKPQTSKYPGKLLAVDAQPDGTIAVKRFWRGNFLWPRAKGKRGHGFKAFRPIFRDKDGLRPATNFEISVLDGYRDYSVSQAKLLAPGFYALMDALINPGPLPVIEAYREIHHSLLKQLESRVREVDLAEKYKRAHPGEPIEMPAGRGVFRTTGPREAYSTPCRDMRLLVGMDTLRDFPARVMARIGKPDPTIKTRLASLHSKWAEALSVTYTRSDGSSWKITLGEAIRRQRSLEMGWNPNDCPEVRWGAPDAERATCKQRAPEEQQKRMEAYRHWFTQRYSCG